MQLETLLESRPSFMTIALPPSLRKLFDTGFDVLSLDVFDTAITRDVECPVDVFARIEEMLTARIGASGRGYAEARELAESKARAIASTAGRADITLREIMAQMVICRPELASSRNMLEELELAAEIECIRPVADIAALAAEVRATGRRVIFVSDMYLPSTVIARLLGECGYDTSGGVLVSSETGSTKASGRQWEHVRTLAGKAAKIVHVGDDPWSDVESPRRAGLMSHHYTACQSDRRVGGPLRPPVLPVSRLNRVQRLDGAAGEQPSPQVLRRLGRSFGAVVVGSFLRWLEDRAQSTGISHLAFCARDGWLLHQAFEAAGSGRRLGVAASYLYVSRRTLNFGHAALPTPDGRLSSAALDRLTETQGTVDHVLRRSGLDRCEGLKRELVKAFGNAVIGWRDWPQLRSLIANHSREVLDALEPMRVAVSGYLAEALPATGHVGLVDLGWRGSSQSCLNQLVKQARAHPLISGFYYGLWPEAQGFRVTAGWMDCAFGSDFRPTAEQPGLVNAVALLENLHGGPHGTTIGYRQKDGRWTPELHHAAVEREQHTALIAPFQTAAIESVAELFETGRFGPVRLDELTPQAGLAAIERLALSPTPEELAWLGQIQHCVDTSHSVYRTLTDTAKRLPPEADWPVGAALALKAANPVDDDKIEAIRRSVDSRTARLFQ